jgi:hypothetical protein
MNGIDQAADGEVYHFVSRSKRLSETVVRGVAFAKGIDPTELEPLHSFIDPAALDVIFANTEVGHVQFSVDDVEVRVHASGEVEVRSEK